MCTCEAIALHDADQDAIELRGLQGLFAQEDASAALPAPGQHPNFGALVSWQHIHSLVTPGRKLLLLLRHGE